MEDKRSVYVNLEKVRYIIDFDDWLRYFFDNDDWIDLPPDSPKGIDVSTITVPEGWHFSQNLIK